MSDIPLFEIYWDDEDVKAVSEVIKRGGFWATGPEIKEFESALAGFTSCKHAVAFNSGTSALHALLLAYGIGRGDEVIVPSFTFISTVNSALFVGAKPVFAEIEATTFGLDVEDVERHITERTKAIMPVHYGGCPCLHTGALRELADDVGIKLIEDAAESLGGRIGKERVGTFGDAAMLSFCQNKVVTTGEGGAVVTNDEGLYNELKLLASHGRPDHIQYFSGEKADYIQLGYNFRVPSMVAALGISQLSKIDNIIEMRRGRAERYTSGLSELEGVIPPSYPEGLFSVYQMYTVMFESQTIRDAVMNRLADAGIASKVYFDPVHLSTFYREGHGYAEGDLQITEEISNKVLSLPIYPTLKDEDIDRIVDEIGKAIREA